MSVEGVLTCRWSLPLGDSLAAKRLLGTFGGDFVGGKGWGSSTRKERLPSDWSSRRLAVLRRDDFKCQWRLGSEVCGVRATDVDHVVAGDDHSFGNLRSLCREHHARKSAGEGAAAYWSGVRRSRSLFREGRGGKHPGVL